MAQTAQLVRTGLPQQVELLAPEVAAEALMQALGMVVMVVYTAVVAAVTERQAAVMVTVAMV
jgi:hypothetical protein